MRLLTKLVLLIIFIGTNAFLGNAQSEKTSIFKLNSSQVQKLQETVVDPQTAVLQYHVGLDGVGCTIILKDKIEYVSLGNLEELNSAVEQLLDLIHQPVKTKVAFYQYIVSAHEIYCEYLSPVLASFSPYIDQLIIIPEGILKNLPFEALISKSITEDIKHWTLDELEYMLKDYAISYAYSLSALAKTKYADHSEENIKNFLGIAPTFIQTDTFKNYNGLVELFFAKKEVESIGQLIGGQMIHGTVTQQQELMAMAANCKIFHIATHSEIEKECEEGGKIFLTEGFLTYSDIMANNFTGELIVLSSCYSGYRIGTRSLAAAFSNAGWKSTISSLWSLDDWSAYSITIKFYKYLKSGYSKSRSLQLAKLDYFHSSDKVHQYPYYWASLVLHGNRQAIFTE